MERCRRVTRSGQWLSQGLYRFGRIVVTMILVNTVTIVLCMESMQACIDYRAWLRRRFRLCNWSSFDGSFCFVVKIASTGLSVVIVIIVVYEGMSNLLVAFEDRNGILLLEVGATTATNTAIARGGCRCGLEFVVSKTVLLVTRGKKLVEIGLFEGLFVRPLASQHLLLLLMVVEIVKTLVLLWLLQVMKFALFKSWR